MSGTKRDAEPISKNDAAVLFTSAAFYLMQAGYPISYGEQEDGKLLLIIEGLDAAPQPNGAIRFVPKDEGAISVDIPASKDAQVALR